MKKYMSKTSEFPSHHLREEVVASLTVKKSSEPRVMQREVFRLLDIDMDGIVS
jgi:hypothetical protein